MVQGLLVSGGTVGVWGRGVGSELLCGSHPPLCGLGIQNKTLAWQRALRRGQEPQGTRWLLSHNAPALAEPTAPWQEGYRFTSDHCTSRAQPCGSRAQQPHPSTNSKARPLHQGPRRGEEQDTLHWGGQERRGWTCCPPVREHVRAHLHTGDPEGYRRSEEDMGKVCPLPAKQCEAPTPQCPVPTASAPSFKSPARRRPARPPV